jgi:hypothetical protein
LISMRSLTYLHFHMIALLQALSRVLALRVRVRIPLSLLFLLKVLLQHLLRLRVQPLFI